MPDTIKPFVGLCVRCTTADDEPATVLIHVGHCPDVPEATLRSDDQHTGCCHGVTELVWGVPHVLSPTVRTVLFDGRLVALYDVVVSSDTFGDSADDEKKRAMIIETAFRSVVDRRLADGHSALVDGAVATVDQLDFLCAGAQRSEQVCQPACQLSYLVAERATNTSTAASKLLVASIDLPHLTRPAFKRASLVVEPFSLAFTSAPDDVPFYALDVQLPVRVDAARAHATFDWHTMQLAVRMPVHPLFASAATPTHEHRAVSSSLSTHEHRTVSSSSTHEHRAAPTASSSMPHSATPSTASQRRLSPTSSTVDEPPSVFSVRVTDTDRGSSLSASDWNEDLLVPVHTTRLGEGVPQSCRLIGWTDRSLRWHQKLDVLVVVFDVRFVAPASVSAQVDATTLRVSFETGDGQQYTASLRLPGATQPSVEASASTENLVVLLRKAEPGWWCIENCTAL